MNIRKQIPTNYGDHFERFEETWKAQAETLKSKFSDAIESIQMPVASATDVPIIFVKKEKIVEVLQFLKLEPGFEYGFLSDITATDETPRQPRFDVVYNLFSHQRLNRIRVKVRVEENEEVQTAVSVWEGANWAEREIFDMFGIKFKDHPNLRRILMDYRWEGHPLRKDYPLKGYQIFSTPQPVFRELLEDQKNERN